MKKLLRRPSVQIQDSFLDLFELQRNGHWILNRQNKKVGEIISFPRHVELKANFDHQELTARSQKNKTGYQMDFLLEDSDTKYHQLRGTFYNHMAQPLRTALTYDRILDGAYKAKAEFNFSLIEGNRLFYLGQDDNAIEILKEGSSIKIVHILGRQNYLLAKVNPGVPSIVITKEQNNKSPRKCYLTANLRFLKKQILKQDPKFYKPIFSEANSFKQNEANLFWNAVDSCFRNQSPDFLEMAFYRQKKKTK